MDILKAEFKCKNAGFSHHKPVAIYGCQWKWHCAFFILYRFLTAGYTLGIFIRTCVYSTDPQLMAFLTMWTYLILTLHHVVAAFVSSYSYARDMCFKEKTVMLPQSAKRQASYDGIGYREFNCDTPVGGTSTASDKSDNTSWYMKLSWCLAAVVQVFALIVTAIFYIGIFPHMSKEESLSFTNINLHAVNTTLIMIETIFTGRPVRLLHFLYPVLYGTVYIIFSVIYWSHDHDKNDLYPGILDWNQPGQTMGVIVGVTFIVIPLVQLLNFGIFRLRVFVFKKIYKEDFFKS